MTNKIKIERTLTRKDLVRLCEAGVVPVKKWSNRDSEIAQRQLGEAWALLRAGCDFGPHTGVNPQVSDEKTIWVEITRPGFAHFDTGASMERSLFYIPTEKRIADAEGGDWY